MSRNNGDLLSQWRNAETGIAKKLPTYNRYVMTDSEQPPPSPLWAVSSILASEKGERPEALLKKATEFLEALTPEARRKLHEEAKYELYCVTKMILDGGKFGEIRFSKQFEDYEKAKGDELFYEEIIKIIDQLKQTGKKETLSAMKLLLGIDIVSHMAGAKNAKTKKLIIAGIVAILAVAILICIVAQPQIAAMASSQLALSAFTSAGALATQLAARPWALRATGAVAGVYALYAGIRGACSLIQGALFSEERTNELLQRAMDRIDEEFERMDQEVVSGLGGTEPHSDDMENKGAEEAFTMLDHKDGPIEPLDEVDYYPYNENLLSSPHEPLTLLEKRILSGLRAGVQELCESRSFSAEVADKFSKLPGEKCPNLVKTLMENIDFDKLCDEHDLDQDEFEHYCAKLSEGKLRGKIVKIYMDAFREKEPFKSYKDFGEDDLQASIEDFVTATLQELQEQLAAKAEEVFKDRFKPS